MKRFFNMIEVVLALGVTAVGIAGLMAVIPVAMNASRDSITDSFIADIVNSQFSQLELDIKKNWAGRATIVPMTKSSDPAVWNPFPNEVKNTEDGLNITGSNGVYKVSVGKKGTAIHDFTADIRTWGYTPQDVPGYDNAQCDQLFRVYMEISWPVTKDYAKREKRVFAREYYNPSLQ